MEIVARILCANLTQHGTIYNGTPVRISVKSWNKPPKCVSYVNMVNAITATIKRPFVLDFIPPMGEKVGDKWQGVIGQVFNNEADVAIGSFMARHDFFQSALLSPPLGFANTLAIMTGKLHQSALHNELHVFTTFSANVWIALLFSIFIIALSYQFLESNSSLSFTNLLTGLLLFLKSLLAQGVDQHSHVKTFKNFILVGTSILSFNILIQCFISVMLANLVSDPVVKINSIEDILDFLSSTKLNISMVTSKNLLPITLDLLKTTNKYKFKKIFNMITTSSNHDLHPEIIVNDLIKGKSIWINFSIILEFIFTANEHLGLHLGSQQYYGSHFGILYSKKIAKELKNRIDSVINSLFESGLKSFWHRLSHRKMNIHEIDAENIITLLHTRGFFILIFIIYIILFCVLLMEIVFNKLY